MPHQLVYRICEQNLPVLKHTLDEKGWRQFDEEKDAEDGWDLQWRSGRFKPSEYLNAKPLQRLNHFPKSSLITMKDSLLRTLRCMRKVHGNVFNFHPTAFVLPSEYTKFIKEYTRSSLHPPEPSAVGSDQNDESNEGSRNDMSNIWIVKPYDLSRGRKIFLIRNLDELAYDQQSIIQRYIPDPITLGGYKLDLRLYVLVTSFHPMTAWLYGDGLVRFATAKYYGSGHHDLYSHLTNSSINKYSPDLALDKEVIGGGCKWTLGQLQEWFASNLHDGAREWTTVWMRTINLINLTLLPLAPLVPRESSSSCFELFGFDVLLDSSLKPWLLEVNCSPALGLDGLTDHKVKVSLISDVVDLLNVQKSLPEKRDRRGRLTTITDRKNQHARSASVPETNEPIENGRRERRDSAPLRFHPQQHRDPSPMASCQTRGKFQQIFPFNDVTAQQAARLSALSSSKKVDAIKMQECCRVIISEVKAQEREIRGTSTAATVATAEGTSPTSQSLPLIAGAAGSGFAAVRRIL